MVNANAVQKAHIDTGAQIKRAGSGLNVTTNVDRDVSTLGIGGEDIAVTLLARTPFEAP